ncbi:MAG: NADH-quinone oxidoreductase subunit NuoH [Candidatus Omnitrophica bacterium]|nr:NADH-quinone oxidoreductase subunit NuoH [Candidatus Omnitrophota bacterium]
MIPVFLKTPWVSEALKAGFWGCFATGFVSANALFLVWLERKVSARIQRRRGPIIAGPEGIFQTVLDSVKLFTKELVLPRHGKTFLYLLAPLLVFAPIIVSFIVIPAGKNLIIRDLNIGFLLIFAMSSVSFFSLFLGGWSSHNKYSALGGIRSVAQNIAYEIPLLLSVMGVVLLTGSLRMTEIVSAQSRIWFVLVQPLAFGIFFCAMLGETNRAPFDLPEAESELVAGYLTEYSGMRFALFFLAEYTHVFLGSALASTLFLGGWQGPLLPGPAWFLIKTYSVVLVVMWVRWTFPRLRSDQLILFSWKVLIPLALLNLLVTALGATLFLQP